jgi:hypothetical protein
MRYIMNLAGLADTVEVIAPVAATVDGAGRGGGDGYERRHGDGRPERSYPPSTDDRG